MWMQKDFITITLQDHNNDMHLKLMLNKLKVMWNYISIYAHWAPNSNKLLNCFSNLHVAHVHPLGN
jgi:hypothetical protein